MQGSKLTFAVLVVSLGGSIAAASGQERPARETAVSAAAKNEARPKFAQRTFGSKAAGKTGDRSEKAKPPVSITPEREAAVMTFVERNHPELVALLELLRSNRPAEYERAIRELHRVTEKLALIKERDPQQYDLELKAWQVHSRIQLLVAKLKMSDSEQVRHELKESIAEQIDARTALLQHERKKAVDRLERIDGDISRLEGDRNDIIEKQFDMFTRTVSAGNLKSKAAGGKKPVARNSKASQQSVGADSEASNSRVPAKRPDGKKIKAKGD